MKSREMRCRYHTQEMRNAYKILVRQPVVSDYLEDLGIYGRTILKLILKTRCEGVEWMNLAKSQWQALVNTVMYLWIT
jgi:hypothetical protein